MYMQKGLCRTIRQRPSHFEKLISMKDIQLYDLTKFLNEGMHQ